MKRKIVFGSLLFILFLLSPSILSAELSNFHYEIIQIAFMNGYINALEPDIDTIKSLKENSERMREYTQLAVNRYMKKVAELNRTNPKNRMESRGQSTGYWSQPWY